MNDTQRRIVAEEFAAIVETFQEEKTITEAVRDTGRSRTWVDRGIRALVLAGLLAKTGRRPQPGKCIRGVLWGDTYRTIQ